MNNSLFSPEGSSKDTPTDIRKAYRHALFRQRENPISGTPYNSEQALLRCVRDGDVAALERTLDSMGTLSSHIGEMSKNPLRQAQYLLVSGVSLMTRAAISGGLSEGEAYNLSDIYIQKADVCIHEKAVTKLFVVALYDFTRRVHDAKIHKTTNYVISKCISYIYDHLHYSIQLKELAKSCKVSPQYLSSLFHKETGTTIHAFILHEKLLIGAELLRDTSFCVTDIAEYLSFSSASSFGAHFKKQYGMTPRDYRNLNVKS